MRSVAAVVGRLLMAKVYQERCERLEGEVRGLRARLAMQDEEARCKMDDLRAEMGFAKEREDGLRQEVQGRRAQEIIESGWAALWDEARAARKRAVQERDAEMAARARAEAQLDTLAPRLYQPGQEKPSDEVDVWIWYPTQKRWWPTPGNNLAGGDVWMHAPPAPPAELVLQGQEIAAQARAKVSP